MNCIFCKSKAHGASVNHILPESLGGGRWACLPDGLVCSECNQYFGEEVESRALASVPFLPFRLLLGIPTKKDRAPTLRTHVGTLRSDVSQGYIGIDPCSSEIEIAINGGETSQIDILAEPKEPFAIARMLVKMGQEVVATDSRDDALDPRFDSARNFSRSPKRGTKWWWVLGSDQARLFAKFRDGIAEREWQQGVSLFVHQFSEFEVFRLLVLDMVIFTPLEMRVGPPDISEFSEPGDRFFTLTC